MSFSTKDVLRDDHVKGSHLLSLPASKGENGQAIEECDIDGMFKFIGEIGKYQIGVNLIMSLFIIAPTYQSLMLVFVGYSPSWKCSRAGNISGACNISGDVSEGMPNFNERCSMDAIYWEYAVPIDYSIVSQVCDKPISLCSQEDFLKVSNKSFDEALRKYYKIRSSFGLTIMQIFRRS